MEGRTSFFCQIIKVSYPAAVDCQAGCQRSGKGGAGAKKHRFGYDRMKTREQLKPASLKLADHGFVIQDG